MKIALIGDSQSEALWPRVKKLLPPSIEVVLTRTQRGWSEANYMKEGLLPQQLADARPDLVVIELGGNNATLNTEKYASYVNWMLKASRDSGATRVLYLGPAAATKEPYASNKVWTRGAQPAILSASPDVVWVDSFPHTQSGHVDGVHFGPKTYDAWAPHIVTAIQQLEAAPTGGGTSFPALVAALLIGGASMLAALRWRYRK